jgi:hypothetical protein
MKISGEPLNEHISRISSLAYQTRTELLPIVQSSYSRNEDMNHPLSRLHNQRCRSTAHHQDRAIQREVTNLVRKARLSLRDVIKMEHQLDRYI